MSDDLNFCPRCGERLEEEAGTVSCACGWELRDPPRLVVAAIVELGETIVLVRNKSWPETWYGLVAGFLDRDETPDEGILRKVKEEVGLSGEVIEIVGAYSNHPRNQIVLTYHVRAHGHVVAGEDIAGVKQVVPHEARIAPLTTGRAVRDWLRRREDNQPPRGA